MSKPKVEMPAKKDPFDDMYSLANNSLTSKVNIAPKPNPFDDDGFTSGSTSFKSAAPADPAAALFGGVKSQKAAEELFGGPDNSSNDFFGGGMGGGMPSSKAAEDLFGGIDNNTYGGSSNMNQSNNMFG